MADAVSFETAVKEAVAKELTADIEVRFKGAPQKGFVKAGAFGPKTFFTRRLDLGADPAAQAKLLIDGYRRNVTLYAPEATAANG